VRPRSAILSGDRADPPSPAAVKCPTVLT
jgi:hypothetical protein